MKLSAFKDSGVKCMRYTQLVSEQWTLNEFKILNVEIGTGNDYAAASL